MRRSTFLKSLAAFSATAALPLTARATSELSMLLPASPGGGWDTTGRAFGQALLDAGAATQVNFENLPGESGVIGLEQFVRSRKADPGAMIMMGSVMLGGIIAGKPPLILNAHAALDLSKLQPLARLTSEYNVFVVAANSPFNTLAEVVAQFKKDPNSVKWGGGARGSTEHLASAMLVRAAGGDPAKLNYVTHPGGADAAQAIMRGEVTIGGSGFSEFATHIADGSMKAVGLTAPTRFKNSNIPTLIELGYGVDIGNWRGVCAPPGITVEQRRSLVDKITLAIKSVSWGQTLERKGWTSAFLAGAEFDKFMNTEFAHMAATMQRSGML